MDQDDDERAALIKRFFTVLVPSNVRSEKDLPVARFPDSRKVTDDQVQ